MAAKEKKTPSPDSKGGEKGSSTEAAGSGKHTPSKEQDAGREGKDDSSNTTPTKLDETDKESTDSSSVSTRGRKSTTPTLRNSHSTTPTLRQLHTPPLGKQRKLSGAGSDSGGRQSGATTPTMGKRFPLRPGISWKAGAKIEAMDFMKKWYPAKIVEVDKSETTVLIHFDGWNQRYDEWLDMSSDRLRPVTRHSGRKEAKAAGVAVIAGEFRPGDQVLAKWSDCKMYPAKVVSVNSNGSYEVLFYDGFKKKVQPINVKVLPSDMKQEDFEILSPPAFPEDFAEKREEPAPAKSKVEKTKPTVEPKVKLAEKEKKKEKIKEEEPKRRRSSSRDGKKTQTRRASEVSERRTDRRRSSEKKRVPEKTVKRSRQRPSSEKKQQPFLKRRKLLIGGAFQAKRSKAETSKVPEKSPKSKLEALTNKMKAKRSENEKRKLAEKRKVSERRKLAEKRKLERKKKAKANTKMRRRDRAAEAKKRRRKKKAVVEEDLEATDTADATPAAADPKSEKSESYLLQMLKSSEIPSTYSKPSSSLTVYSASGKVKARKEFKIETDHNHYKCPFENCGKSFRKQSLVDYHIRYYHTEDGSPIPPPPPRKRSKTLSMCSNDSDISVTSRGSCSGSAPKSSKRKRTPSGPSELQTALERLDKVAPVSETILERQESGADTEIPEGDGTASTTADSHVDEFELDEVEVTAQKDEVVNCLCQYNEESGLMIQCDVCLCWQHAVCAGYTEETPTKKYICFVCLNPMGVRESARYIYEQDWWKQGQMARFGFLPVLEHERKSPQMKAVHSLMADMHNMNTVLKSLKRKVTMAKDPEHPDIKVWSKNWEQELERRNTEEHMFNQNTLGNHSYEVSMATDGVGMETELVAMETSRDAMAMDTLTTEQELVEVEGTTVVGEMNESEVAKETESVAMVTDMDKKGSDVIINSEEAGVDMGEKEECVVQNSDNEGKIEKVDSEGGNNETGEVKGAAGHQKPPVETATEENQGSEVESKTAKDDAASQGEVPDSGSEVTKTESKVTETGSEVTETGPKVTDAGSEVTKEKLDLSTEAKEAAEKGDVERHLSDPGPVENTTDNQDVAADTEIPSDSDSDDSKVDKIHSHLSTPRSSVCTTPSIPDHEYGKSATESSIGRAVRHASSALEGSTGHTGTVTESASDAPQPGTSGLQSTMRPQDYKHSPVPTHVKLTGSSVWTPVAARNLSSMEEEGEDRDDGAAEAEEPLVNCHRNLVEHILNLQDEIEQRMDFIDEQVSALEMADEGAPPSDQNILADLPRVKKTLRTLIHDLTKVKRMATFH